MIRLFSPRVHVFSERNAYVVVGFPGMIVCGVSMLVPECEKIMKSIIQSGEFSTAQYFSIPIRSLDSYPKLYCTLRSTISCVVCGSRVYCKKHSDMGTAYKENLSVPSNNVECEDEGEVESESDFESEDESANCENSKRDVASETIEELAAKYRESLSQFYVSLEAVNSPPLHIIIEP